MKENLLKIISFYGIDNQLRKFNEEVFELSEAIITFEKSEDESEYSGVSVSRLAQEREHIIEELADCLVMIDQFRLYYDISIEDLKEIMEFKVDRQLDRMKEEK
jgi:NTP pyrophosphatase (non-canonical NTP hydrolase)